MSEAIEEFAKETGLGIPEYSAEDISFIPPDDSELMTGEEDVVVLEGTYRTKKGTPYRAKLSVFKDKHCTFMAGTPVDRRFREKIQRDILQTYIQVLSKIEVEGSYKLKYIENGEGAFYQTEFRIIYEKIPIKHYPDEKEKELLEGLIDGIGEDYGFTEREK